MVPEDVSLVLKVKDNLWRCPLFRMANYGDLIYRLYDGVPLEVHIAILNEVVEFWFKKGMPEHFLDACFLSIFENELLYDESLEGWRDQGLPNESYKKAIVKVICTVFHIQEMLETKE